MDRRALLKLAGMSAMVPVLSKADALRVEKGEEPKESVELMPTPTGTIRHWTVPCEDWNKHHPITIEIEVENNAESSDMLHRYMGKHFEVAIVPIIEKGTP